MFDVYWLDLIGVFAFAFSGARKGMQQRFDTFGVLCCAFLTAFGGGTIREMLVHSQPVYFHNYTYLCVMIAGTACALATRQLSQRLAAGMLVLDAIGLATFAYIGAARAAHFDLGVVGMGMFAVLTAAGGGILTDLLCRQKPGLFFHDFYATPAMLLGIGYCALGSAARRPDIASMLIATTCAVRLIAVMVQSRSLRARKYVRASLTYQALSASLA